MEKKSNWKLQLALIFLIFGLTLAQPQQRHSFREKILRNLAEKNRLKLSPDVTLWQNHGQVTMDNGIVGVTFSRPDGHVIGIKYNKMSNVLDFHNTYRNRGYWDVVWNRPHGRGFDSLRAAKFKVVNATRDKVEISFTKNWDSSDPSSSFPLNIDKRFILRRGDSGYYAYAIFERLDGWPQMDVDSIRHVYKLLRDKFTYMAVSDDRRRIMPSERDRRTGQALAYKEAVLLNRPINPNLKGEVDDKYQYAQENMVNKVHGWVCRDPHVGFWMITASDEYRGGGPLKQELTSHVGPTTLAVFTSDHYAGKDMSVKFEEGEKAWKKVYGPVFVYLNSNPNGTPDSLWEDAKNQSEKEKSKWPYDFVESDDFPSSDKRGTVTGRLMVQDRYAEKVLASAKSAYVGLAAPGQLGSWQRETKGYQFWTRADEEGYFSIKNIRPGNYSLYAWVPGVIADYKYNDDITVTPGSSTNLTTIIYEPPRQGPTLWEIGIPDRKAGEFYIPDPSPSHITRLYNNTKIQAQDKFRQYGLWERYSELYPDRDLVYNVETDNYRRDWFFAHVTRVDEQGHYQATTWQIVFRLHGPKQTGSYTLRLALAASSRGVVDIRFNNPSTRRPHFTTGYWNSGKDNAIARHGIHGLYLLLSFEVSSDYLIEGGDNIIYLTQRRNAGPFLGVLYDYIRFEGVH